jgi:orotidine-5'-phosphate decarboxylase
MKKNLFTEPKDKLIIAIDNISDINEAKTLIEETSGYCGWYKIGLEVNTAFGSEQMINLVKSYGAKVFYDGKFHDIPNTVGKAVSKLSNYNVDMLTIHCSSGIESMVKAVENKGDSCILGVTVLTSHTEEDSNHIFGMSLNDKVYQFAQDAFSANMDGIVCSPKELLMLSKYSEFDNLVKITPGIHPEWMKKNDQNRTMTPSEAILNGATAIVVGRAITAQENKSESARLVLEEIEKALSI